MIEYLTQISYFGFNKKMPYLVGAFIFIFKNIIELFTYFLPEINQKVDW